MGNRILSFGLRLLVNFLFDELGIQSEQSVAHASREPGFLSQLSRSHPSFSALLISMGEVQGPRRERGGECQRVLSAWNRVQMNTL